MIDPEREELLSAFLDGEVSPEERARVEQWLAESDELRQLRDELVAMRAELQGLPRRTVGHDLAAVVMHRSTTAVPDPSNRTAPAADPTANSVTPSSLAGDETSLGTIVAEWWNRGSQGRRFLWPVLAVAAALAILVFDARQRPAEFEVANAPEAAPAELREESIDTSAASDQPSIGGVPETAPAEMLAPETSSASAFDTAQSAPAPLATAASEGASAPPQSNELRAPATGNYERNFGAMRGAAPAERAGGTRAGESFFGKRAEQQVISPAVQTIVCPVTPQYLEGREFEKLLDANQVRWQAVPISPELQAAPPSPRTAPLESLGKYPLQSLYFLQVKSDQAGQILSQVPQADRLMEGNRMAVGTPLQQLKALGADTAGGVQVMLVAPSDAKSQPTAPAAK